MKKQLHIARNGQVVGLFDSDKISHLLETGQLLPTDHYYDDTSANWLLVTEWREPVLRVQTPRSESKPRSSSSSSAGNSRPRSKSKNTGVPGLAGWITCVFIVGLAAGLWVWNQTLDEQIVHLKEDNTALKSTIVAMKQVNDSLNQIAPSGSVRGIVIYEPAPGQTAIISGATIGLYSRAAVEKILAQIKQMNPNGALTDQIEQIKTLLPPPIAVTLTDSNGSFDLKVPGPGDYVLAGSANKGGVENLQLLWLAGFPSQDRPSPTILFDEKNAFSEKNTALKILNVPFFLPAE